MTQHENPANDSLQRLNDTNLTLDDSAQDVRGSKVIDRYGQEIGHVSDLFIDESERKLRLLEVSAGGFLGLGERHFLLPVEAITGVNKDEVRINQSREHVVESPAYDPKLIARPPRESWEPYYGYYGYSPYWTAGYMYPPFPPYSETPSAHGSAGPQEEHRNGT